jgi:hypothetical protein
MASTYSALKIELIGTGDQAGVWGNTTNVNLGDGGAGLEQAIVGMATLVTGDFTANSYTMTYTDTNALQDFRALVLDVTATLSANGEVIVPAIQKPYLVFNNSVGGYSVTFKVVGQTGVTVPNGYRCYVYNNGTDVIQASTFAPALTANQIDILAQGDLRLQDSSGGQYVALQAPATIASSYTLTMPTDDGNSNQVLTTDGSGVLTWTTPGVVNSVSVVSSNGFAGTSSGGATPALTLSTTITGVLKGNGTAISAASAGTDYAPATSGTSILYGNGSGGFSSVTVGTGLSFVAGTLSNSSLMTYPAAGIAVSTGTAWTTSLTAPSGTIVGTTDTQTLTNKRINLRVSSTASTASLTVDSDATDQSVITALAAGLTVNAPTGTPVNGQKLTLRFKDNGTAQTIGWNAAFRAIGVTLPTTTVISKVVYIGCIYNSDESTWDVVSVAQQA